MNLKVPVLLTVFFISCWMSKNEVSGKQLQLGLKDICSMTAPIVPPLITVSAPYTIYDGSQKRSYRFVAKPPLSTMGEDTIFLFAKSNESSKEVKITKDGVIIEGKNILLYRKRDTSAGVCFTDVMPEHPYDDYKTVKIGAGEHKTILANDGIRVFRFYTAANPTHLDIATERGQKPVPTGVPIDIGAGTVIIVNGGGETVISVRDITK